MDFGLSDEQEMLKRSARDFLQKELPKKLVRELDESDMGYSPEVWKKMADLGWTDCRFRASMAAVTAVSWIWWYCWMPWGTTSPRAILLHRDSWRLDRPGCRERGPEEGHTPEGRFGRPEAHPGLDGS